MKNILRALMLVAATSLTVAVPVVASADTGSAHADTKAPSVSVDAKFDRFLVSPRGEIRGLLLTDGSVIHAWPGAIKDSSLHNGDALHIDAKKHSFTTGTLYGHAIVKKGSSIVVDTTGKHEKGDKADHAKVKLGAMTDASTVSSFIVGHKGHITGVVLADGTQAYAGHKASLDALGLKKGDSITVNGKGGAWALGRSIKIESVKMPDGSVKNL